MRHESGTVQEEPEFVSTDSSSWNGSPSAACLAGEGRCNRLVTVGLPLSFSWSLPIGRHQNKRNQPETARVLAGAWDNPADDGLIRNDV